jgi:hypothetical protein
MIRVLLADDKLIKEASKPIKEVDQPDGSQ